MKPLDTNKKDTNTNLVLIISIFATLISSLFGVFGDEVIKQLWRDPFGPDKLPYSIFAITVLAFLFIIGLWGVIYSITRKTASDIHLLSTAIGQRVEIVPFSMGYKRLQRKFKEAEQEILLLSDYVYDWENDRPIYDTVRLQSTERKRVYEEVQRKLKKESNKEFKFVKIVQVPVEYKLEQVFERDPYYRDDCILLAEYSAKTPEFASLRLSDIVFSNTFCIVDRSFLYLEFQVNKTELNQVFAPFVMLIDDPNSETIQELLQLHQRIEASSQLITKFEI